MLHFIIGEARSGKSEHAERLAAGWHGTTVYVGTLFLSDRCEEAIKRHKARRPRQWQLIELVGNPETDVSLLSTALADYRNVLLDGLAFYITQLFTIFDIQPHELRGHALSLIRQFADHDGEVIVVDQPVPPALSRRTQMALRYVHQFLARRAHTLTLVENRMATPLLGRDLLRLDRRDESKQ